MRAQFFFSIVRKYNELMKNAIEGPNCIDPNICRGDCCSIQIDVPKVLAEEYIKRGYATKDDFIRSNIFAFKLRFNERTGKCFLFDMNLNGCKVHNSGIKPPQCWIYPTNFINNDPNISCKKVSGWKIIDLNKTREARKLLDSYIFLCKLEAKKELKLIEKRLGIPDKNIQKIILNEIGSTPAREFAGLKDGWEHFSVLNSEGISLQVKKFCQKYNSNCKIFQNDFLTCNNICKKVANALLNFYQYNIKSFIKKNGLNCDGKYTLLDLVNFKDKMI
ncbi:MAG: hypothetical protein ACTSQP_00800 [Promethearchaeota archaeon]